MVGARQHFDFLDGLRGVAAVAVVILHAVDVFRLPNAPVHAALAVDFFFCLSGFVVAYAYERRLLEGMAFGEFIAKRMIRLYPMIVAGVLLGGVAAAYVATHEPQKIAIYAAAGFALLPIGIALGVTAFPVNAPMWSLFYEIVANAAYGLGARWIGQRLLLLATVLSGALLAVLVIIAGQVTMFGTMGLTHFLAGFVRVAYPFLAGVLIFRLGLHVNAPRIPAWILALVLIAVLFAAFEEKMIYQALMAVFLLPAIVALAARAEVRVLTPVWKFLGELSYPLYLIHMPVLLLVRAAAPSTWNVPATAMAAAALSAMVSWGVLKIYDRPIRAWLNAGRQAALTSRS